jgi:hypothetical protein
MRIRLAALAVLSAIFVGLVLSFGGCSGRGGAIVPAPATPVDDDAAIPPAGSLAEAIAQVESAPTPAGVDPALYAELQAELVRVIREAAAKGASIPPTGERNEIADLELLGNDILGWRLEWTYLNAGDYNRDTMVNVSDLTEVGRYFDAAWGDWNWFGAHKADGNGDDRITVADITPIGQNFEAHLAGFRIYGADSLAGPWTLIDVVDDLNPPVRIDRTFYYEMLTRDYGYYRVVPYDGDGAEGVPSGEAMVPVETPVVALGEGEQWDAGSIGTGGGTLSGPDLGGGPITLEIPAGAVGTSLDFELGTNGGTVTQGGEDLGAQFVYLTASDFVELDPPARIILPLPADQDTVAVGFRMLENGQLSPLGMPDIDYEGRTASFDLHMAFPQAEEHQTSQFMTGPFYRRELIFINMIAAGAIGHENARHACKTPFEPDKDGFKVNSCHDGDDLLQQCALGIGPFCCWYFHKYRDTMGSFSQEFSSDVQRTIMMRAVMSVWIGKCHEKWQHMAGTNQQHSYEIVKAAIRKSNGPVFVLCSDSPIPTPGDFRVAYGYTGDKLHVYEPFKPGKSSIVEPLSPYYRLILLGTDAFPMYENFEYILRDALEDPPFGGSNLATLFFTSHTGGDFVVGDRVQLEGYVTSGDYLVKELHAINPALPLDDVARAELPPTGEFSVSLPIQLGRNRIQFTTRALVSDFSWRSEPYLTCVPNEPDSFILFGDSGPAAGHIRVEVTTDGTTAEAISPVFIYPYWYSLGGDKDGFDGLLYEHPFVLTEDFCEYDMSNFPYYSEGPERIRYTIGKPRDAGPGYECDYALYHDYRHSGPFTLTRVKVYSSEGTLAEFAVDPDVEPNKNYWLGFTMQHTGEIQVYNTLVDALPILPKYYP